MNTFYDLLITIIIAATAAPAVILLRHRYRTKYSWEYKHKNISLALSLALLFGTVIIIYGSFIEPKILTLNEQTINLPNIKKPILIALISDMQVGPYRKTKWMEKITRRILNYKPDIVLIAGDMVNNSAQKYDEDETFYLEPLKELANKIPVYAVPGNHEYGVNKYNANKEPEKNFPDISKQVANKIKELGAHYLTNELRLININDQYFYLFGGDSLWAGKLDFKPLEQKSTSTLSYPTIALIHNQAAVKKANLYNINLVLSGHTHGGQIRLPFIGPVGLVDNTTPRSWYQGLNQYGNTKLFVTSGLGETGTRARLFNPPEIVLITIN